MTNENNIKFTSFNGSVRSSLSMLAFNGKADINDFHSATYRRSGTITGLVCAPLKHSVGNSQLASI
jgi:hypothetical protein